MQKQFLHSLVLNVQVLLFSLFLACLFFLVFMFFLFPGSCVWWRIHCANYYPLSSYLDFCTFSLCPLVLPPDSFTKFSLSMNCFPVTQLYMLIASPLSLSFSSVVIPSSSSLSSYVKPCKPGTLLAMSLCTFQAFVMSFFGVDYKLLLYIQVWVLHTV